MSDGPGGLFSTARGSGSLAPLATLALVIATVACAPPAAAAALGAAGAVLAGCAGGRESLVRLASRGGAVGLATLMATALLPEHREQLLGALACVLAVAAWVEWFRERSNWPDTKASLRRAGVPTNALDQVDQAVTGGLQLWGDLVNTREAMLVRLGTASWPAQLAHHGLVLAVGASKAFDRSVCQEEAVEVRASRPLAGEEGGVALERVTVIRSGREALADVTLSFAPGEWVVVAGPNGAGKSTLIRLIVGLERAAGGSLRRLGVAVDGRGLSSRLDGRVAVVQQDPDHQLLGCTPREDIGWTLRQRGRENDAVERAVAETLAALGLSALADRPVAQLSGGQRKLVALAAALITAPDLLLLDEPTAGLDPVASRKLVHEVELLLARRPTTVIWVSHELWCLPNRARRVVLLAAGRVLADAPRERALAPAMLERAGLSLPETLG